MTTQSDNHTKTLQPYTYVPHIDHAAIEKALMAGDISKMDSHTRVQFYLALCHSTGLNPLTRPFITMKGQDGSMQWYPTSGACEQLRKVHHVSISILSRERSDDGLYCVTVKACLPEGRKEESQGVVYVGGLKGQELANALMRCESKAKRRATLAICGLGMAGADDEAGQVVAFDPQTGAVETAPREGEAEALLQDVGQWFRTLPKAHWEPVAQAIWGVTRHEMPHLGLEELRAGWHVIDQGRAPLAWDSPTLHDDVAQWRTQHARQAVMDVFDRSEGRPEGGAP